MPPTPVPIATTRVQLTPDNGFAQVTERLDTYADLGISHVYLSPVTEAVPGSQHGYDVVDHARVRDELGGMDGLRALLDALVERGMGALIDHVPNHVAVSRPELNPHWWEMLATGPGSSAARWFDVDWDAADGKVVLPVLGRPLDDLVADGELRIDADRAELWVGEHQRFPLADGTADLPLADAIAAQHYRLQWWRDPTRNVRRFFTIDDLVAVRVEDPEVAAVVDTVPRQLLDHPGFAGVRVDHVDGLADPGAYLTALRELLGERWLLVEKILADGEVLAPDWPVDGTTGYEHARALEQAFVDEHGLRQLRDGWEQAVGDDRPYAEWEEQARREALTGGLRPDVERVARVAQQAGVEGTDTQVAEAVIGLSQHLGRYRTYLPGDAAGAEALQRAYETAVAASPDQRATLDALVMAIATHPELRTRWQQLTGPATAKGVEDRVFFRYVPLSTLNEVGADPMPELDQPVAALHDLHRRVAADWPLTLLTGTTHDTKRAQDVRARGLALAADPNRWSQLWDEWTSEPRPGPDAASAWLALQTAVAAFPIDAERLHAFLVKAAREADQSTAWSDPDEAYETALADLAGAVSSWAPVAALAETLAPAGRAASLGLLTVRLTAPGVPDVYQGTERFRYLLTDPDNRVEPDDALVVATVERAAGLDGPGAWAQDGSPAARAVVLRRVLDARRRVGPLAGYEPVPVVGPDAGKVIAYTRFDETGRPVLVTVVRCDAGLGPVDAAAAVPGRWRSELDDGADVVTDQLDVGAALARFPAVVLTATD